jgi:hypothetical protein
MQAPLRPNLPPLPHNMRDLPVDTRGYPVPFFVQWINGVPEFRLMNRGKMDRCVLLKLCWVCGKPLGNRLIAFTIGPMCAINRISSEPPQHPECAEFSAMACPFLPMPKMRRRTDGLPEGTKGDGAGIMIDRNPGVTLVWLTRRWTVLQEPNGYLFSVGAPIKTMWFAEGRRANRSEVLASIESGLPLLRELAVSPEEMAELETRRKAAMKLLPKEVA